jgi:hypothetical protein
MLGTKSLKAAPLAELAECFEKYDSDKKLSLL